MAGLLPPLEGKCTLGNRVEIGYFDQHTAAISSEKRVVEHFHDLFPSLAEKEVRQTLGAYLFGGKAASAKVSTLSGGEKARLVLAELLYGCPNLLLLDEPTNHMDIQAKETLESAFQSYRGTILFVSHDRYFIEQVADAILVFDGQSVMYYPFGYGHYLERKKKEKNGNPAALLQAEEQALISGLRAVPKAERHILREISTEDAYLDWQLRLAAEQMETAGNKVELLWEKWCGKKAFLEEKMWKESAGDAFWELPEAEKAELEELRESLNEAWDTWNETCLVWQEIWDEWV